MSVQQLVKLDGALQSACATRCPRPLGLRRACGTEVRPPLRRSLPFTKAFVLQHAKHAEIITLSPCCLLVTPFQQRSWGRSVQHQAAVDADTGAGAKTGADAQMVAPHVDVGCAPSAATKPLDARHASQRDSQLHSSQRPTAALNERDDVRENGAAAQTGASVPLDPEAKPKPASPHLFCSPDRPILSWFIPSALHPSASDLRRATVCIQTRWRERQSLRKAVSWQRALRLVWSLRVRIALMRDMRQPRAVVWHRVLGSAMAAERTHNMRRWHERSRTLNPQHNKYQPQSEISKNKRKVKSRNK